MWKKAFVSAAFTFATTLGAFSYASAQCEVQAKDHYVGFRQYDSAGTCYTCIGTVNSCGDLTSYTCRQGCSGFV